jgi:hypothetical protein
MLGLGLIVALLVGLVPATAGATTRSRAEQEQTHHLCVSVRDWIRFIGTHRKPSGFKEAKGHRVLDALVTDPPARLQADLATIHHAFEKMRDHGGTSLTTAEKHAYADALFHLGVFAAARCKDRTVRLFGQTVVQARISADTKHPAAKRAAAIDRAAHHRGGRPAH